ncbi:hypothetical protein PoB_005352500 [Plakobranchus ocellatus]|uniref:Uncharacterized protein n=1 Tax=Plakobranchus ocellatus TaxID=259542 RepID=A0AAV4C5P7_9GAST|nr:hypothetical protein PoB_005352500 [Plakobranchus ocellatus]
MKVSMSRCDLKIAIKGTPLKYLREYKYRGSIYSEDGDSTERLRRDHRWLMVLAANLHLFKHCNIPTETKAKLIGPIFIITLIMTWTKGLERKIISREMRCPGESRSLTRINVKFSEIPGTEKWSGKHLSSTSSTGKDYHRSG